jgi:branched-subunit amino acid transport protein AzlD
MSKLYAKALNRFALLLICSVLCSQQLSAVSLPDSVRISLITCAPGEELYSCFGHSAIRITSLRQGFDLVFNYGTFDFNQPNFYPNFVRGHMIYMLGVDHFEDFRQQYVYERRSIWEQELNLTDEDKVRVFDFLINNAKEENRNYRYDFLFDNCSTRIRDVFQKNASGIQFDYSTFKEKKSFRDLINDYSESAPWSQFGMGLLIGLPVDRQASPAQMCFLPDYLSRAFAHATINGKPLCGETKLILDIKPPVEPLTLIDRMTPTVVFGLLLIVILLIGYIEIRTKDHFYGVDVILFFLVGIMGTLFFVIGNFTEHTTTQWDLNVIWALPTHVIMALVLPFAKDKKWVLNYFLFSAIISAIMVVGWKFMPQKFLFANILIAATMAIRSYSIYWAPRLKK